MHQPGGPAIERGMTASRDTPDHSHAAHARLVEAERLRRAGNLDGAQAICQALLKEHPNYVGALQTLGVVHLERRSFQDAYRCLNLAALLCPEDAVTLDNLANAYMGLGGHTMAAHFLSLARNLRPHDHTLLWTLANLHREQRDYGAAADVFRNILKELPASADAAHGLGDCLVQLGQIEEARDALDLAHRLDPSSIAILYSLSQLPRCGAGIDLIPALAKVRRQKGQGEAAYAMQCALTRAAACDQRADHAGAWASIMAACRLAAPAHDAAFHKQRPFMAAALRAARAFAPVGSGAGASAGPVVLFIVGPSRSGKTTLEKLAATLPGVHCGHESRLVERATRRTSQLAGFISTHNPNDLPAALDGQLRANFAEDVAGIAGGAHIVTDTYPAIIPYVGKVAAVLPNVRFVFMDRDPYDTALRTLLRQYRAGNHHAYGMATVFEYLEWYRDMARAWRGKLPGISLDVAYGDMVADPAATRAKVAHLCGVEPPDKLPAPPGDDRGCASAYRAMMDEARSS